MGTGKRWNVIAFPVLRSEQREQARRLFEIADGRIVAAPTANSGIIHLDAPEIRAALTTPDPSGARAKLK